MAPPGKYRVEVTAAAERDLHAIQDYIAEDDPVAAQRWVARLARRVAALERFPLRGAVIPEAELFGVSYRHLIEGRYRMIYRIDGMRVIVVRVVHGAQLLRLPAGEPPE